jgi:CRP-like cAMP-binding protein
MGLLQGMGARYRQSEALLALLGLRRIEDRVRGFLELLANDYGQPCEQGLRLQIKLTHQELASTLSTTRVTGTRILGALRAEGWLQIDSQRRLVVSHLPHQRNPHR